MKATGRPQTRIPSDLITPAELIKLLGISRSGLQGMVERARVPHYRLGSRTWFSEKAVMADMQRQASEKHKTKLAKIPTSILLAEYKRRQAQQPTTAQLTQMEAVA